MDTDGPAEAVIPVGAKDGVVRVLIERKGTREPENGFAAGHGTEVVGDVSQLNDRVAERVTVTAVEGGNASSDGSLQLILVGGERLQEDGNSLVVDPKDGEGGLCGCVLNEFIGLHTQKHLIFERHGGGIDEKNDDRAVILKERCVGEGAARQQRCRLRGVRGERRRGCFLHAAKSLRLIVIEQMKGGGWEAVDEMSAAVGDGDVPQ